MKITLTRIYTCSTYTIGHLYVNGKYVCDTVEDTDRGLDQNMSIEQIKAKKVYKMTAIPTGTYKVTLDVKSPKFSQYDYYAKLCKGYLPRLLDVKGFEGVLMHCGSTAASSAGCLIVGYNTIKGCVTSSRKAFELLMQEYLMPAKKKGEKLEITIESKYKKNK